jgi:hypothetical protein
MYEIKKLEVEKAKVEAAKMDFELKIMSAKMEIERLESNIINQENRVKEIIEEIKQLQGA